jgi:hypothetical protein
MPCSPLCEDNFISIYEKFDSFGERVIRSLNKSNVEMTQELKKIVDEISLALVIKTKLNMEKITRHHARLEASSRVLEQMLQIENQVEPVQVVRHVQRGLNIYQFVVLMIIFLIIGINFEIIRARREKYTEIL